MKCVFNVAVGACVAMLLIGCANRKWKEGELLAKQPINCATAEGDIRTLQHEKAHTSDQIASGVQAILPASLVVGLANGTEGTSIRVASGEYNEMIDKRIAEIKRTCGIR